MRMLLLCAALVLGLVSSAFSQFSDKPLTVAERNALLEELKAEVNWLAEAGRIESVIDQSAARALVLEFSSDPPLRLQEEGKRVRKNLGLQGLDLERIREDVSKSLAKKDPTHRPRPDIPPDLAVDIIRLANLRGILSSWGLESAALDTLIEHAFKIAWSIKGA